MEKTSGICGEYRSPNDIGDVTFNGHQEWFLQITCNGRQALLHAEQFLQGTYVGEARAIHHKP
jgi:hypothetical protein